MNTDWVETHSSLLSYCLNNDFAVFHHISTQSAWADLTNLQPIIDVEWVKGRCPKPAETSDVKVLENTCIELYAMAGSLRSRTRSSGPFLPQQPTNRPATNVPAEY